MAYGAVTRSLVKRNAELEAQLKEMRIERDALNAYVYRVSDTVRLLQRRLRDAGLDDRLGHDWRRPENN